jgi:hypothetical protein
VFIAIATHWQLKAEAWPTQATLGTFAGLDERTVRPHVQALEAAGIIRVRRERQPGGHERLFYQPGSALLAALEAFARRYPRPAAGSAQRPPEESSGTPPENPAATPPAESSGKLSDQNPREHSSSSRLRAPREQRAEQKQPRVTTLDREVAHQALVDRLQRMYPNGPATTCVDANDIDLAAACSATIGGDRAEKLSALGEATAGAFRVSKPGPPRVRFIFGRLEHFREHVDRERRWRDNEAREKERRCAEGAILVADTRRSQLLPQGSPGVSPATMHADIRRIFPNWRAEPSAVIAGDVASGGP